MCIVFPACLIALFSLIEVKGVDGCIVSWALFLFLFGSLVFALCFIWLFVWLGQVVRLLELEHDRDLYRWCQKQRRKSNNNKKELLLPRQLAVYNEWSSGFVVAVSASDHDPVGVTNGTTIDREIQWHSERCCSTRRCGRCVPSTEADISQHNCIELLHCAQCGAAGVAAATFASRNTQCLSFIGFGCDSPTSARSSSKEV